MDGSNGPVLLEMKKPMSPPHKAGKRKSRNPKITKWGLRVSTRVTVGEHSPARTHAGFDRMVIGSLE